LELLQSHQSPTGTICISDLPTANGQEQRLLFKTRPRFTLIHCHPCITLAEAVSVFEWTLQSVGLLFCLALVVLAEGKVIAAILRHHYRMQGQASSNLYTLHEEKGERRRQHPQHGVYFTSFVKYKSLVIGSRWLWVGAGLRRLEEEDVDRRSASGGRHPGPSSNLSIYIHLGSKTSLRAWRLRHIERIQQRVLPV
jgi:hypothetical protein